MLSMSPSHPPDSTSRSRQKRVGDALRLDTRNRILEAAAEEFSTRGYTGTTVTRLASAAGVSVQTLYLAWGSKRALLRGYMEGTIAGDLGSPEDAGRQTARWVLHGAKLSRARRQPVEGDVAERQVERAGAPAG